jgi:hypothetical protein
MNEKFELIKCKTIQEVIDYIKEDEGHCCQQVAFSSFHTCLTQINFTKKLIRSSI